jgi:hypothetical protein
MPNAEDETIDEKIDTLIDLIEVNGIERIRTIGESVN